MPPADNPLVYFVDAGHNGDSQTRPYSTLLTDSQAFAGAQSIAVDTLHNELPDQRYVAGTTDWGWTSSAADNYKLSVTGGDPNPADAATLGAYGKYELGVRTNGTAIIFRLALDPGSYTLSSGFFEFYTGAQDRSRIIEPTISYTVGGAPASVALERAAHNTPAGTTSRTAGDGCVHDPRGRHRHPPVVREGRGRGAVAQLVRDRHG